MKTLLSARVHPWQLFRFKKYCEWSGQKPSFVIQEALKWFFHANRIWEGTKFHEMELVWLKEYHEQYGAGDETDMD